MRSRRDDVPAGGSAEQQAPLRLTARGRVVVWALATALAAAVGLGAQSASAGTGEEPRLVHAHTVVAGETLWDIASAATPSGEDVRDLVADVMRTNELAHAGLVPGQRLLVPVSGQD